MIEAKCINCDKTGKKNPSSSGRNAFWYKACYPVVTEAMKYRNTIKLVAIGTLPLLFSSAAIAKTPQPAAVIDRFKELITSKPKGVTLDFSMSINQIPDTPVQTPSATDGFVHYRGSVSKTSWYVTTKDGFPGGSKMLNDGSVRGATSGYTWTIPDNRRVIWIGPPMVRMDQGSETERAAPSRFAANARDRLEAVLSLGFQGLNRQALAWDHAGAFTTTTIGGDKVNGKLSIDTNGVPRQVELTIKTEPPVSYSIEYHYDDRIEIPPPETIITRQEGNDMMVITNRIHQIRQVAPDLEWEPADFVPDRGDIIRFQCYTNNQILRLYRDGRKVVFDTASEEETPKRANIGNLLRPALLTALGCGVLVFVRPHGGEETKNNKRKESRCEVRNKQ